MKAAVAAGRGSSTGGERMLGNGNYFEPTVMVDVPRSCPVYREELFGPVAMLFRVKDLERGDRACERHALRPRQRLHGRAILGTAAVSERVAGWQRSF